MMVDCLKAMQFLSPITTMPDDELHHHLTRFQQNIFLSAYVGRIFPEALLKQSRLDCS